MKVSLLSWCTILLKIDVEDKDNAGFQTSPLTPGVKGKEPVVEYEVAVSINGVYTRSYDCRLTAPPTMRMARWMVSLFALMCFGSANCYACFAILSDGAKIGVCYGMLSDNLPSHDEVVNLLQSSNIEKVRLYQANQAALEALKNS
ncbi:hypothetical protein SUGI_0723920 [Cryptomeria japonica]|nr:hypothetical protein SUGI_0723920 [Cryptomeria japonica]